MKKITVLYTCFQSQLDESLFELHLKRLPTQMQSKIRNFIRWQDQHSRLFAKLLLQDGLIMYGFPENCLEQLSFTKYERPFINHEIDFNISHSGQYCVCAVSSDCHLGVDIEHIRTISIDDFDRFLGKTEFENILAAPDPMSAFFKCWTIKEGAVKAEGKGLSLPFDQVHINNNAIYIEDSVWYYQPLDIHPEYHCHVVYDMPDVQIVLVQKTYDMH
ncbi:MAG: 4'-phosphopantetheinyl transferase superfamily protein [Desulfobacterales bacterium]|nr:4'-phosphopantetheinyl transferase superfamily protein [Desulfobacterales bacterium]